ncbi:MAG: DUF4139 domain-containing protein [Treponema sp.]|jgi:hypothetical protein|nr:DUF4139 domain-containing protein [Treponema sp.]
MKNNNLLSNRLTAFLLLFAFNSVIWAQAVRETAPREAAPRETGNPLPLRRVVILTSGMAYYEHSGAVNGPASFNLPFNLNAVNDALKSLVINDPASANPSVIYQSEQTLIQTLRSLKIDLSDEPGMAAILSRLKGAEIEIAAPTSCSGRIVGVEYRSAAASLEPWLLLSTVQGLRHFNLNEIGAISFKDAELQRDLNRSLDLIAASRNSMTRQLLVTLQGNGTRNVSISYVIPSPVWKISYRLDLGAEKPLFQGWAIIDNDGDNDWDKVELSLVAGRPVSFIQNLYPPYYVNRPTLPLALAGTAQAESYDAGMAFNEQRQSRITADKTTVFAEAERPMPSPAYAPGAASVVAGGTIETARGEAAGDQFEFTIKNPVSLDRRMSAMLPLAESKITGQKLIIYSGTGRHPRLGAEITNTTGMKLPAGPITVYDGGVYSGDALIEFWNEDEKRLISFGEDLSVTASSSDANTRSVTSVAVSGGVMTINRSLAFIKTYSFKNSGAISKRLIVEHPKTAQTELISPAADEQTASVYRFSVTLAANSELVLTVSEQRPIRESVALLSLRPDAFLSYSTNQEIPPNVQTTLQRAIELRRTVDTADLAVKDIDAQKTRMVADQDRIRRNLEAVGSQTQQGQEYIQRLTALDNSIDNLTAELEKANASAKTARETYENYLNGLKL